MIQGRPIHLLLVEDDPSHARIVLRNLSKFRVANPVTHLEDGQAALDYLLHQNGYATTAARPDLVLLDLRLPKVDGLEVLERMKADADLRLIPVVVLTTSSAESDMMAAYSKGACSYLEKPIGFEKFTDLMSAFGFYWLAWNQYPLPGTAAPQG